MQPLRFLGPALLVAGFACLALAVGRGEATAYLVVIVPVITATGPLALLGVALVFLGFFATFLFMPSRPQVVPREGEVPGIDSPSEPAIPARRWGGIAFLGPFPIIFGSDPRMTRVMLLLGILLFVALLALTIFVFLA